jgi:hypothetical protein
MRRDKKRCNGADADGQSYPDQTLQHDDRLALAGCGDNAITGQKKSPRRPWSARDEAAQWGGAS